MGPEPHSPEWYDRLARMQEGYSFPWRSRVAPLGGEELYLRLLRMHLSPDADVLDAGCGHGEVALAIAPLCRSVLAYDRVAPFIRIAARAAGGRGAGNVSFLVADSSAGANGGRPRIPAEPRSFDVLTSRRGPLHWIEDARRVARPGAALIQLSPGRTPPPPWNGELPEALRMPEPGPWPVRASVERRLGMGGLELDSCWEVEAPEVFDDPRELYAKLSWGRGPGEAPAYGEVRAALERIYAGHAGGDGLAVRLGWFLWKALAP